MTAARYRYGSAILSALLLAAAFPPLGWDLLAWVALVPWFSVLVRDGGEGHRGPAFVFGFVHFTTGLWWLSDLSVLFPPALSSILALYPLLLAFLYRRAAALGPGRAVLLLPFLWVGVDFLREHLATGFPWLLPGHAMASSRNLRQAADLGGVHLLTFLLVLHNAAWAAFAARRGAAPGEERGRALLRAWLGLWLAALVLGTGFCVYGAVRRSGLRTTPGPRVLLVQPSFPQTIKKEAMEKVPTAERMRNDQLALSIDGVRRHPETDLVVWAETMIPGELRERERGRPVPDGKTTHLLLSIADPVGVVPGGTRRVLGGGLLRGADQRLRNSILLVGPRGAIEGRSDKEHLTPFGEYIPLLGLLPAGARKSVEDWVLGFSPFLPNLATGETRPLPLGLPGGRTVRLGGLVCYEVLFPALARDRVREGADVLVNLSNYAWYGAGMREQALEFTRMRAVETRRPVVAATNDGPTAILDGNGEVVLRLEEGRKDALYGEVPLDGRGSLYVLVGDLFAWLCSLAGLAGVAAGAVVRRSRGGGPAGAGGGGGSQEAGAPRENC